MNTMIPQRMAKRVLAATLAVHIHAAAAEETGTFVVPMNDTKGWEFLNYRNIPPNTFHADSGGLEIRVANSAAPAVFPLEAPLRVTGLRVSGTIRGALKVEPGKQGEKGQDDYVLRVGLVESGSRTLSWKEQLAGAGWVKRLFALAPRGAGISKIHFFNIGSDAEQLGRTRTHPMSDLMEETIAAAPGADGCLAFAKRLDQPLKVLAIWISCDGDDTQSSFTVTLDKVELETEPAPAK